MLIWISLRNKLNKVVLEVLSKNFWIRPASFCHGPSCPGRCACHQVWNHPFTCQDKEWGNSNTAGTAAANYCCSLWLSRCYSLWMKICFSYHMWRTVILCNTFFVNIKYEVWFIMEIVFLDNVFKLIEVGWNNCFWCALCSLLFKGTCL